MNLWTVVTLLSQSWMSDTKFCTTEINFESIFQKCREQWIGEIRSKLKVAWTQQLSNFGEVLFIQDMIVALLIILLVLYLCIYSSYWESFFTNF
jgi:hypothetical protein